MDFITEILTDDTLNDIQKDRIISTYTALITSPSLLSLGSAQGAEQQSDTPATKPVLIHS